MLPTDRYMEPWDPKQRVKKSANVLREWELSENSEASESRNGLNVEAISYGGH